MLSDLCFRTFVLYASQRVFSSPVASHVYSDQYFPYSILPLGLAAVPIDQIYVTSQY